MKELFFITGFLGAGKTTFLKKFIQKNKDKKIHVIINEFGKVGVDGKLLEEVRIQLDEINNGSILCSCRLDQFATAIELAIKNDSEMILVEASGFTDPTNLKKLLKELKYEDKLRFKGCICIVDAKNFLKVYSTAIVVKKQIKSADIILINKSDLVSIEQIELIKNRIREQKEDMIIKETTFGEFDIEWFENIRDDLSNENINIFQSADITQKKFLLKIDESMTKKQVEEFIKMFLHKTYRIKGILKLNNKKFLLDCVGNDFKINEYKKQTNKEILNKVVVLSGQGLNTKKTIEEAIKLYPLVKMIV